MAIHVGLLTITIAFDESFSLKDKRQVLRSMLDKARRDLHVSIAETAFQNRIRSAEVAVAFVSSSRAEIERAKERAEKHFDSDPRGRVEDLHWQWL